MALHLLYRTHPADRQPNGRHACLVDAADEAAARTLATVPHTWAHHQLAATASMPSYAGSELGVVWLEGDAISLLGVDRGGNRVR